MLRSSGRAFATGRQPCDEERFYEAFFFGQRRTCQLTCRAAGTRAAREGNGCGTAHLRSPSQASSGARGPEVRRCWGAIRCARSRRSRLKSCRSMRCRQTSRPQKARVMDRCCSGGRRTPNTSAANAQEPVASSVKACSLSVSASSRLPWRGAAGQPLARERTVHGGRWSRAAHCVCCLSRP